MLKGFNIKASLHFFALQATGILLFIFPYLSL